MTAYKKAPARTNVEGAEGTIRPVDGFGTVEVDLNQPGTTTKPVKMVAVTYVPGISRNLLPTRQAVEQWGKPLVYYKTKAVVGFPEEESLVFNFCPRKGLFSATGVRRTPSQGAAPTSAAKTAETIRIQWGAGTNMKWSPNQDAALAVATKTRDIVEVHRMFTHPSEEITQ